MLSFYNGCLYSYYNIFTVSYELQLNVLHFYMKPGSLHWSISYIESFAEVGKAYVFLLAVALLIPL